MSAARADAACARAAAARNGMVEIGRRYEHIARRLVHGKSQRSRRNHRVHREIVYRIVVRIDEGKAVAVYRELRCICRHAV